VRFEPAGDGAPSQRDEIGLLGGLGYPLRGARFVYVEHRSLAKFWLPPIVLTTIALVAVGWVAFSYRAEVLQSVWAEPTGAGWLAMVGRWLHSFVEWVVAFVMIAVGAVAVALSTSLLAAPFNDALSEAVERLQTGRGGPPLSLGRVLRDLRRTMGLELRKLAVFAAVMLPLLIVSFAMPVVGPLLYAVCAFFLTAMFFAIDYVDWPASRHDLSAAERTGAALRHFRPMLGLGVGVWLFMYVPLLNLLFMPAAVAGGTLLWLDLNPQLLDIREEPDSGADRAAEGSG
jgi:CysZ protein